MTYANRDITDIIESFSEVEIVNNNLKSVYSEITILIPTFNAESFISETIKSAIKIQNATLIVVDDNSTDDTLNLVNRLLIGYPNYLIARNNHKGSPGFARNFGLLLANSKWIWFLDCDDIPILERLELVLEVANTQQVDSIILNYLVRYDSKSVWALSFDKETFSSLCPSDYEFYENIFQKPELVRLSPHPSRTIYEVNFLKQTQLAFDVNENFEDGSFWPRMLSETRRVMLWNWPQLVYRVRKNSVTYSNEIGRKKFLISQFMKITSNRAFLIPKNQYVRDQVFLYGLEMVTWPLGELVGNNLKAYRRMAKDFLRNLDDLWLPKRQTLNFTQKIELTKKLLKFGLIEKTLKLWKFN